MGDMLEAGFDSQGGDRQEPAIGDIISDALAEGEGTTETGKEEAKETDTSKTDTAEKEAVEEKPDEKAKEEPGAEKEPETEEIKPEEKIEKLEKSYKEIQAWNTKVAQENKALKEQIEEIKAKVTPAETTVTPDQLEDQILDGMEILLDQRQKAYDEQDQGAYYEADAKIKQLEIVEKKLNRLKREQGKQKEMMSEAEKAAAEEAKEKENKVITEFNELKTKYGADVAEEVKKMYSSDKVPTTLEAIFKMVKMGKTPPRPQDTITGEGGQEPTPAGPEDKELDGILGRMHDVSL